MKLSDTSTDAPGPGPDTTPVLVSACLLGLPTRYDGKLLENVILPERFKERILVPVCPEQLGGLPTPRPPQDFRGGTGAEALEAGARVVNENGIDVTKNFLRGAQITCEIAQILGVKEALLKDGSPSCGVTRVTVAGRETTGAGVTTAALRKLGLEITACL
jgi:uncharacterized protein YbbK (DUF523 family)